jgi:2-oxoglutarate dehydrogenase E2 component (dihydrolipoamide succinyltransferase)
MDVVMPQLGETVREGIISIWHKKVGDTVRTDEPLFEVETDKVTMDIPAPAAGVLAQILIAVGERAEVGARLAVIRTAAGDDDAPRTSGTLASAPRPPSTTPPPSAPRPPSTTPPPSAAMTASGASSAITTRIPSLGGKLSPVVRKLLAEHHIDDPAAIPGTGADGRITRDDVLAYVGRRSHGVARGVVGADTAGTDTADTDTAGTDTVGTGTAGTDTAGTDAVGTDTVVPMTRIRKLTAEHMVRSVATSPHVLQAVEVDFLAVEQLRTTRGEAWRAREGFTLSYLPFVARAVCLAIPEFPHVNATVRGDTLVVHHRVNLGIAVDLDRQGLIVPVVKHADNKTVRELALEIHRLAGDARRGALGPDDLTEGTYTLSNSGPFGTLITAPIIYQPQVAILSTDGVKKRPVVIERSGGDTIEIRPVGVLAQCFDHRAFDGAYSAAFLRRVREILEHGKFDAELA